MVENVPLPHKIHMLAHVIEQVASKKLHEKANIAFNSFIILHVLNKKGETNQNYLAQKLQLTTAAISRRIKLLIERELVTVLPNTENRRENLVNITPTGKELHKKATESLNKEFNNLIKDFKEKEEFELLLNKLLTTICSEYNDRESC